MASEFFDTKEEESNFLEYFAAIRRRKWLVILIVLIGVSATGVSSMMMEETYKTEAVIMPLGGGGGGGLSGVISQFGSLASLVTSVSNDKSAQFMTILQSRTLAENIIKDLDLLPILCGPEEPGPKDVDQTLQVAAKRLKSHMEFSENVKLRTLTVAAEFGDPIIATKVVNGYVAGLQNFISQHQLTMAKHNRVFIEEQLAKNKSELLYAGIMLNEFYKQGRVSNIESKIDVPIEYPSSTLLKASPQELWQTLNSSGDGDSVKNFDAVFAQHQVLERHIKEYKEVKNVPQQVYLQYLILNRTVLEQINNLLSQQYEASKIEEAKDDLAFQVIDPARLPLSRFRPQRKRMMMIGFSMSLLLGVFAACSLDYVGRLKKQITT